MNLIALTLILSSLMLASVAYVTTEQLEALKLCQAVHSVDVCYLELRP